MQNSCIFCKIISGDIPSSKVYEDEKVYAFRDINPQASVHVLVVPKAHIESADAIDASLEEAGIILQDLYPETNGRPVVFCVSSWLLSPELPEILPPESNILAFRDRFHIFDQWPAEKDFFNFIY